MIKTQLQRDAAALRAAEQWRDNRATRLLAHNASRHPSPIRDLRLSLEMSQDTFAKAIGLSGRKALATYENGMKAPKHRLKLIQELAEKNGLEFTYTE